MSFLSLRMIGGFDIKFILACCNCYFRCIDNCLPLLTKNFPSLLIYISYISNEYAELVVLLAFI